MIEGKVWLQVWLTQRLMFVDDSVGNEMLYNAEGKKFSEGCDCYCRNSLHVALHELHETIC